MFPTRRLAACAAAIAALAALPAVASASPSPLLSLYPLSGMSTCQHPNPAWGCGPSGAIDLTGIIMPMPAAARAAPQFPTCLHPNPAWGCGPFGAVDPVPPVA